MTGYIYKIVNKENGKTYVGQTNNIERRWYTHKYELNNNKHYNLHLQNSWNKYGENNFSFEIIEECSIEDVDKRESYWIKELNTLSPNGYNMTPGGLSLSGESNPFYGKHHTEETRKILSEKHTGIYDGENNPMYGKNHTKETIEKIKQTSMKNGNYEKQSETMEGNKRWINNSNSVSPIIMKEEDGVKIFFTRKYAGEYLKENGISKGKNPGNTIHKFLWENDGKHCRCFGREWDADLKLHKIRPLIGTICGGGIVFNKKYDLEMIKTIFDGKPMLDLNNEEDLERYINVMLGEIKVGDYNEAAYFPRN